MTTISAISTCCKNCIFSVYNGKTQTGCELGRTKTVEEHEVYELISARDDDKNFYVLNNHICPYQRTKTWAYADQEDKIAKAKEEVYMPWAALLFYRGNGIDAMEERIKELRNQSISPKVVTLIISEDITEEELRSLFQMMEDNLDTWYLQRVLQEDLHDRFTGDLCFDKMKKHRFMFYSYFESTRPIDADYYDKIHKFVIDDMHTYGIMKNKKDDNDVHHLTISKVAHVKYGGNGNGVPLEYKIAHENKDLTWADINSKNKKDETLEDKFIIDYKSL